jgi:hypothetical protein
MIEKILRNKNSQNIFAFLIGFGLTILLFHRPIPKKTVLAMNPSDIEGKEVRSNGKCFVYRVEDSKCESHLNK